MASNQNALHTVYVDAAHRLVGELGALDAGQLASTVPACPEWSVRDVLAHLAGVATDVLGDRMDGAPGSAWTARQVAERQRVPASEVLEEFHTAAAQLPAAVFDSPGWPALDIVVHEGDIREALALPGQPQHAWEPVLRAGFAFRAGNYSGSGTMIVDAGEKEWVLGTGEPTVRASVDTYELHRALFSRRSAQQMQAWGWDGDPLPHLTAFPFFGLRVDDQPRPGSH